jgi:hypothetical protein
MRRRSPIGTSSGTRELRTRGTITSPRVAKRRRCDPIAQIAEAPPTRALS